MKSNINDCLKYWRVIRQYVKIKYELNQADLDMLLFLYSEERFAKSKFQEFSELVSWDVGRFNRLLRDGWIENFRRRTSRRRALYSLSFKAKRMITSIYKKLSGEEIPMTAENNPMFKKNVSFTDKVYRNMIKTMNAHTKQTKPIGQPLHHVPE
jgi:hypothetical protein